MKTHPAITHPVLRHRMAQALNELRHENLFDMHGLEFSERLYLTHYNRRWALRVMAERMAALEQTLDDAQEARIFGTIPS